MGLIDYPGMGPRRGPRRKRGKNPAPFIVGGAVAAILIVSLLIWGMSGDSRTQPHSPAAADEQPEERRPLPRMSYKEATELYNSETDALERLEAKRDKHIKELYDLLDRVGSGPKHDEVWELIKRMDKHYQEEVKDQQARVQEAREARERSR